MRHRHICLILLCLWAFCARAAVVDTVTVTTSCLDSAMRVVVIQPLHLFEEGPEAEPVPTLYLLHGYGGKYSDWIRQMPSLPDLADQYGMLIVMPDGRDSWYWDAPRDSAMRMETFFARRLVPYIDSAYRTIPQADKRAITGLSMGGHGALWLAMRHPDIWANAGSMSGGVDIRPFPKNWKMARWLGPEAENQALWDAHTVATLVPTLKPGQLNITFDCGEQDFFRDVNLQLHNALLAAGIDHEYTSRPGRHTWQYWRASLPRHLMFFSEKFQQ